MPGATGGPLYRRVKLALLQAIESGRYPAGGALPSETELSNALGVSVGALLCTGALALLA